MVSDGRMVRWPVRGVRGDSAGVVWACRVQGKGANVIESSNGPLEVFGNAILALVKPLIDFILGFFPEGDPEVFAIIDGFGSFGGGLSFNVFYFFDMQAILVCFGVMVTVILIVNVLKLVLRGMDMAARAIEAVPVVE